MNIVCLMAVYQAEKTYPKVAQSLDQLDPPPTQYVFCENNSTDNTLGLISDFKAKKGILRLWFREDAPQLFGDAKWLMAIVRQFLLQRARQLDPDFAVFLDADVEVKSEDLIRRFTGRTEFDIVGGAYTSAYPDYMLLDAMRLNSAGGVKPITMLALREGQVLDVDGVGGGCMCIKRKVLQDRRINFHPIARLSPRTTLSEDFAYCVEAKRLDYHVGLNTTVRLSHQGSFEPTRRSWHYDDAGVPIRFTY